MNFDKKPTVTNLNNILIVLALIFSLTVGFFVGSVFFPRTESKIEYKATTSTSGSTSVPNISNFQKFNQLIEVLNGKFYYKDRLQTQKIEDATLKGLVEGLQDAPTRYLNTQEYSQYKDSLAGNISGIGVEIGAYNEGAKINAVYADTPAFKAGVKKDDVFVKVNDKDVTKTAPSDVASIVRGPAGSTVSIVFLRAGQEVKFDIVRDKITTESISYEKIGNGDVCKIAIKRYTDDTLEKWKGNWNNAVSKFLNDKCKGLVVDIRNNGGGYVEAAKYAIEEFVADGQDIYGQKQSDGSFNKIISNRDKLAQSSSGRDGEIAGRLRDTKVVILINSNSASASEIFSGSVQTSGRAKLVGVPSYGKGSVQQTYEFNDGSALVFTVANWTLQNGKVIDNNFPINPDVVVSLEESDVRSGKDPQLDKAIELLK